jgi:hypothetical protein
MSDLLNDFWKATENEKHLRCYSSLVRRARPYTLDDDAVELLTELASGPTINDKLSTYRILARLPFDVIWIAMNYDARFNARVKIGTSKGSRPQDAPIQMGWLMERITDTMWRAITVTQYLDDKGRTVTDAFGITHVVSTEGNVEFRSFARDPGMREMVKSLNAPDEFYDDGKGVALTHALGWGFGDMPQSSGTTFVTLPRHLNGSNAVDLSPGTENMLLSLPDLASVKIKKARETMMICCRELQGDLRFLCATLATLNEVPLTYADVRPPGKMRAGGKIREYLVNRVVTIAIPKKRGRLNKVLGLLRLAERRMRRHEVSGYWQTVYSGPGRTVKERRWINEYMRGDAQLGYVRQEREVVKSK